MPVDLVACAQFMRGQGGGGTPATTRPVCSSPMRQGRRARAHTEAASASRTDMHTDVAGEGEQAEQASTQAMSDAQNTGEGEEEEEEEPHCRYCFMGADEADKGKLCSPCACSGSQAFVHLQCLQRWQSSTLLAAASNEVSGGGQRHNHQPSRVSGFFLAPLNLCGRGKIRWGISSMPRAAPCARRRTPRHCRSARACWGSCARAVTSWRGCCSQVRPSACRILPVDIMQCRCTSLLRCFCCFRAFTVVALRLPGCVGGGEDGVSRLGTDGWGGRECAQALCWWRHRSWATWTWTRWTCRRGCACSS